MGFLGVATPQSVTEKSKLQLTNAVSETNCALHYDVGLQQLLLKYSFVAPYFLRLTNDEVSYCDAKNHYQITSCSAMPDI